MKGKRLTAKDRQRLADPVTFGHVDKAQEYGEQLYAAQIAAVMAEMNVFLNGRNPRSLVGADSIAFMEIKARFDALSIKQRDVVVTVLHQRLNPDAGDGSEMADA